MRPLVPDHVVGHGEFVLHLAQRSEDAGADRGKARDGDSPVLVVAVEIERGRWI